MTIRTRTKILFAAASAMSRPVWLFLAVEALVAAGAVVVVGVLARRAYAAIDLSELPPWRALVGCLVLGGVAHVVRAARPVDVLRRWHGVVVRRIDERWADDR